MRRAILCFACLFSVLMSATPSAYAKEIQMLPPVGVASVLAGTPAPCGTTGGGAGGVLQWDGDAPLTCIPNFVGDKNGYVGIGTTVPEALLSVVGNTAIYVRRTNTDTIPHNILTGEIGNGSSPYTANIQVVGDGSNNVVAMPFNFTSYGEVMRLTSNGNVGIGTTLPQTKLDVSGEMKVGNTNVGCSAENEGAIRYNKNTKTFEGCDGTSPWTAIGSPTPHNVSASRTVGALYQNMSGRTMLVVVCLGITAGSEEAGGYIGPTSALGIVADTGFANYVSGNYGLEIKLVFSVPNNWYYTVIKNGYGDSSMLETWVETY